MSDHGPRIPMPMLENFEITEESSIKDFPQINKAPKQKNIVEKNYYQFFITRLI